MNIITSVLVVLARHAIKLAFSEGDIVDGLGHFQQPLQDRPS